jgi:hypothetical protein
MIKVTTCPIDSMVFDGTTLVSELPDFFEVFSVLSPPIIALMALNKTLPA